MIWISLLHLSLFLGVSSKRHIFTASFSFVSYENRNYELKLSSIELKV